MDTKIELKKEFKEFIDTGFGFPVRLLNVPMLKVRGVWTPAIDYNDLALKVLFGLAHKSSRLTGVEIKFIRTHFEKTLQQFAKLFCVSHVAVLKWEKAGRRATAMHWSTEKDIRLFILSNHVIKGQDFMQFYTNLQEEPPSKPTQLTLDAKKLAA